MSLLTTLAATAHPSDQLTALAAAPPGSGPPPSVDVLGGISASKGSSVLPATGFLHDLASALGSWALIASVIGLFAGSVIWAFGSYSQNYQQAYNGRRGVLVSGLAALLIGAGPYLIGFFYSQGSGLR